MKVFVWYETKLLNMLNSLYEKNEGISQKERLKLYNLLGRIKSGFAKDLFVDISANYMNATSNDTNSYPLKVLRKEFDEQFLRALIDIGTFWNKLEDACGMTRRDRFRKWKHEKNYNVLCAAEHKEKIEAHSQYSNFLYECRDKNKIAYDNVKSILWNPTEDWQVIIASSAEDLHLKSPIFFKNVQTGGLSNCEKRALIHKYGMIYNILPAQTKQNTSLLMQEVFISEKKLKKCQ